jgi:hypothetical protein
MTYHKRPYKFNRDRDYSPDYKAALDALKWIYNEGEHRQCSQCSERVKIYAAMWWPEAAYNRGYHALDGRLYCCKCWKEKDG